MSDAIGPIIIRDRPAIGCFDRNVLPSCYRREDRIE